MVLSVIPLLSPLGLSYPAAARIFSGSVISGSKLPHHRMVMPLDRTDNTGLAGATEDLLQCMADAATGEEIESCELAYEEKFDAAAAASDQPAAPDGMSNEDRERLWGANGQLLNCIEEATTGEDIESCELAYDATFEELEEKNRKFGI